MLYFWIIRLASFISILKSHDLKFINNILFWILIEYLNKNHYYNDFYNFYSLIDLKNNLLKVEKK